MKYVTWCEMFSIQVPYIDNQHKKLLDIANELHAAIKSSKNKDIIFIILNSLIRYTEEHFRDEESVMELSGYPPEKIEAHKKIHEQLVKDIFALHEEFKSNDEKSLHEVEVFLNSWMIQHILTQDKKLTPYCMNLKQKSPLKQE